MVGSVLLHRMREERDFEHIAPTFFSTSQAGGPRLPSAPRPRRCRTPTTSRRSPGCPCSSAARAGDYTEDVHPRLRAAGWQGYWIDAASALRMKKNAVIVLDPVNLPVMQAARERGVKDFIGGNCTVSLMLMAVGGLLRAGVVEWITAMTYQSASGAGAKHMRELLEQMGAVHGAAAAPPEGPRLGHSRHRSRREHGAARRAAAHAQFGVPLAASLIPWIDKDPGTGQSREEWKAGVEANKIMGFEDHPVPVEGICVRVSAMRCHSQALTIKLKQDLPLAEIEKLVAGGNSWVRVVPNEREASIRELSPAAVSGGMTGAHRPPAQAGHGRGNIYPPLRWATSCCGARRNRCAELCDSCFRMCEQLDGHGFDAPDIRAVFADGAVG